MIVLPQWIFHDEEYLDYLGVPIGDCNDRHCRSRDPWLGTLASTCPSGTPHWFYGRMNADGQSIRPTSVQGQPRHQRISADKKESNHTVESEPGEPLESVTQYHGFDQGCNMSMGCFCITTRDALDQTQSDMRRQAADMWKDYGEQALKERAEARLDEGGRATVDLPPGATGVHLEPQAAGPAIPPCT